MKKQIFSIAIMFLIAVSAHSQQADSLMFYLETAARNNPQVNADFSIYKASLEKVPQASALPDPELEAGFFFKPMDIIGGKQIADFTVMQMFPWFGTRKAAKNEATEMARMAYEKFRESRDLVFFEVKSQWYQLLSLNAQIKNAQENIKFLEQLEQLAINRFSAPTANSGNSTAKSSEPMNAASSPTPKSSDGMAGMNDSKAAAPVLKTPAPMASMGGGGMKGNASGGMSDILRIQIERAEAENMLETLVSNKKAAIAKFNALLNREADATVTLPDSFEMKTLSIDGKSIMDSIYASNPMLAMVQAEGRAYKAKAEMDKKMSLPMLGVGLQYSVIGKSDAPMTRMEGMNGKDMLMPMIKVSLPIFRKKYNAQQRENEYYRKASEYKYKNLVNTLESEYIGLKQQLDDAGRKVKLYQKQHELSLSTYRLILSEFASGSVALSEVIQVERQILDYGLKKSETIAEYNTLAAGIERLLSKTLN